VAANIYQAVKQAMQDLIAPQIESLKGEIGSVIGAVRTEIGALRTESGPRSTAWTRSSRGRSTSASGSLR